MLFGAPLMRMHPDRALVDKYLTSFDPGALSPSQVFYQVERHTDKILSPSFAKPRQYSVHRILPSKGALQEV
jgi:hypothetical protein